MIGIDTNVLVRYLVQDDPEQSQQATRFIETECSIQKPAFINGIVLCELVWVLETVYAYPKQSIAKVIEKILRTRQFFIYQSEILWQTLRGYQRDGADFADHYIAILNAHNGCDYTATFDKKASRLKYFEALS
jgi:predicted nucleic-acid-binding protein